jgi:hypothetical protein
MQWIINLFASLKSTAPFNCLNLRPNYDAAFTYLALACRCAVRALFPLLYNHNERNPISMKKYFGTDCTSLLK